MKAIRDLLCLRSSGRSTFGINGTVIAGDGFDFGMMLKPLREAVSGPIRQEFDHAVQLQLTKMVPYSWLLRQAQSSTPKL